MNAVIYLVLVMSFLPSYTQIEFISLKGKDTSNQLTQAVNLM